MKKEGVVPEGRAGEMTPVDPRGGTDGDGYASCLGLGLVLGTGIG